MNLILAVSACQYLFNETRHLVICMGKRFVINELLNEIMMNIFDKCYS